MEEIYIVVYMRGNKIETVVRLTKCLSLAQCCMLDEMVRCLGKKEAGLLLADFSNKTIMQNVTVKINDDLNLQMFEFEYVRDYFPNE